MRKTYTVDLKSNYSGNHHKFLVTPHKAQRIVDLCINEMRTNPVSEDPIGTLEGLFTTHNQRE